MSYGEPARGPAAAQGGRPTLKMQKRLMNVTRRSLIAGAVAAPAIAQAAPATPEAELEAARESLRRNAEALAKVKVPVETEPAFLFKA